MPELFDLHAQSLRRARARQTGPDPTLHRAVAREIEDRLAMVNRRFTRAAVVTPFPELWGRWMPAARIIPPDETLALDRGAHDLVIHALALHAANDPVGQLVQARLALVPDGLLLAVVPAGRSLAELRAVMAEAELAVLGGISPRVAPMADIRDLGALLQRAGFALPVADALCERLSYPDIATLARDLRAIGESNALAERLRRPAPRALFREAERLYRAHFPDPEDPARLQVTLELVFLTGWAPAPGQPQPLRPGAARQRLADALGTIEHDPLAPETQRNGATDDL